MYVDGVVVVVVVVYYRANISAIISSSSSLTLTAGIGGPVTFMVKRDSIHNATVQLLDDYTG
jgi:hypothetical protein